MTDDFIDGVEEKMPGRVMWVRLDEDAATDPNADPPVFATQAELNAWTDEHATDRDIVIVHEHIDYSQEVTR